MSLLDDFTKIHSEWEVLGLSRADAHATVVAMTSDATETHIGCNSNELASNATAFVEQFTGLLPDDIVEVLGDPSQSEDVRRYAASLALGHLSTLLAGEAPLLEQFPNEFA